MRNYFITLTLRNGCRFGGVISARSPGHARLIVRAETGRTDIARIDVESL